MNLEASSGRNCSLTAVKVQYNAPIAPCIFRVKELGPGGPVEGKPAEIGMPENYHMGTMSPQNSALALLKTANVSGYEISCIW